MNPETFYRNTEMCRVCPRTANLTNLYHSSNGAVLNNLKLIVSIDNEAETLLPKFICQICTASVKHFIDFKKQCEERDKEMRENIGSAKQNIKREPLDIFDTKTGLNDEIESYDFIEKIETEFEIESDIFNDLVEEDTAMESIETDEESTTSDDKPILPKKRPNTETETDKNECKLKTCTGHEILDNGSIAPCKFSCKFCDEEFTLVAKLSKHHKVVHKKCPECFKVYPTYYKMRIHLRTSHKKNETFIPTEKNECKLQKCTGHEILENGLFGPCKFKCSFCDEAFTKLPKLKEHQEAVHKKCPECLKEYPSFHRMTAHIHRIHKKPIVVPDETFIPTEKNECKLKKCTGHEILDNGLFGPCKFKCNYCDEEFSSIPKLNEHQDIKHKQCPRCLRVYPTYYRMLDHFQRFHKKVPKVVTNETFPCELCDKVFKVKSNISRHVRSHHNNERLHHCETCGMGFFEIGQLKSHLLKHTEERPVLCDFPGCDKTYKSREGLRSHKITHLPIKRKRLVRAIQRKRFNRIQKRRFFICSYCGKQLKGITSITMHQRIHTNEKPHECNICSAKFRSSSSLNVHLRTHTNSRPYTCGVCNKTFSQKSHLTTHSIVHNEEKKFSCEICNMTTKYKVNLRAHMRDIHRVGENVVPCEFCEETFLSITSRNKHKRLKHKDAQSISTE